MVPETGLGSHQEPLLCRALNWTSRAGDATILSLMRRKFLVSSIALTSLASCVELPPERIVLLPQAENVELLSETPNLDVYESYGLVSSEASGKGSGEATVNARNGLRNKAAALRATFVSIEEASATGAWDFSGRTVVTLKGHVYRPKD